MNEIDVTFLLQGLFGTENKKSLLSQVDFLILIMTNTLTLNERPKPQILLCDKYIYTI